MIDPTALRDTADHDMVMSWLQDRELKDHKLGDARSGKVGTFDITMAIDRMRKKAYGVFPDIDPGVIDTLVRDYVDPLKLTPARNA